MSGMAIGLSVFAGLMVLLVFRVHVGIGMFFAGSAAFLAMNQGDFSALLFTLNNLAYARLSNYDLAVIPLFMLMGQFATNGGLSKSLFRCAAAFIGHFRGGWPWRQQGRVRGSVPSAVHRWPQQPPWARWPCLSCVPMATRAAWPRAPWLRRARWAF
jgi:hypothetical protein